MQTVRSVWGALALVFTLAITESAAACVSAGPQTPRDISGKHGTNARTFSLAPSATKLNLCNIHFHRNAEHKGPGFAILPAPGSTAAIAATGPRN